MVPLTSTGIGITATTGTMSTKAMAADLDAIQNRVAVALAKREWLIKSWTASTSKSRALVKTQEELDAEDADLFNPSPARLGLGAPIPKEFLDGDVKRKEITSNNKLKNILLGNRRGLQASKPRNETEKAGSTKRRLDEESSDDDQGRSSLGKAKKFKTAAFLNVVNSEIDIDHKQNVESTSQDAVQEPSHVYCSQVKSSGTLCQTTPASLEKRSSQNGKARALGKIQPLVDYDSEEEGDGDSKECTTTPTSMGNTGASHTISSFGAYSKDRAQIPPKDGKQSQSAIMLKSHSTMLQINKDLISKQNIIDHVEYPLLNTTTSSKSTPLKSGSNHNSLDRASTTESEPSDMGTAIPSALVPGVVGQTSLATPNNTVSSVEAKRAKNRQKRQRKKEREQQRKAMESSTLLEKSSAAVTVGIVIATKKIKDRLLDADGK